MTEHLKIERQADIACLVIDRTDKRNAFKYEMWRALPAMATELENDPAVRVIVLRGLDNTAFSAGADIDEFETSRADAEGAQQYNAATYAGEHAIARLSKPTIAMVQGPCIGGGCGLALACDVRFTDETGRFGITPAKRGIVYSLTAGDQAIGGCRWTQQREVHAVLRSAVGRCESPGDRTGQRGHPCRRGARAHIDLRLHSGVSVAGGGAGDEACGRPRPPGLRRGHGGDGASTQRCVPQRRLPGGRARVSGKAASQLPPLMGNSCT